MMASLGCQIYSYDHTVDYPDKRGDNIRFHKTGLGKGPNLNLLEDIVTENGHQNTTIEYLKVGESNLYFIMPLSTEMCQNFRKTTPPW